MHKSTSHMPNVHEPVVHLPSVRLIWRTRDDAAATTVLALCDEIERLRIELDGAKDAATYHERTEVALRERLYRMRVDITEAMRGKP